MSSLDIALTIIIVLSITLNALFLWYIRKTSNRLLFISENLNDLITIIGVYRKHLKSIYEMEIFVEHLKGKKETVKGLAGLGDLYVSSGGGRNAKMGSYIGEGLTFSKAKKAKMEKITVEGADLAIEIGKKVNEDFENKKLP